MNKPKTTTFELHVVMADGEEFDVVADQRDIAAFECESFGVPYSIIEARIFTAIRYLAWRAGKRSKLHSVQTWTEWTDACLHVADTGREDGQEPSDPDPGNPAASAAP